MYSHRISELLQTLHEAESLEMSGLDYKRIEGQVKEENYYRIRIGGWRIGLLYNHPNLLIITVLARGDIYKKFPPQ